MAAGRVVSRTNPACVPYETAEDMCASLPPIAVMTERIAAHPRARALARRACIIAYSRQPELLRRHDAERRDATHDRRPCVRRVTRATRAFDGLSRRSSLRPSDVSVVASHVFEPDNNEPVHRSVHPILAQERRGGERGRIVMRRNGLVNSLRIAGDMRARERSVTCNDRCNAVTRSESSILIDRFIPAARRSDFRNGGSGNGYARLLRKIAR